MDYFWNTPEGYVSELHEYNNGMSLKKITK
jgi:hypothetical protein